jgi:hypothetical protein
MSVYVVEQYESARGAATLTELSATMSTLADSTTAGGQPIRFVRSTFIPSDEICFGLWLWTQTTTTWH